MYYSVPAVWMNPDSELCLCTAINKDEHFCKYGTDTKVVLRRWSKLIIRQPKYENNRYIYSITINGRQAMSVVNNNPRVFEIIDVIVGDWLHPQKVYIWNLYVEGYEQFCILFANVIM